MVNVLILKIIVLQTVGGKGVKTLNITEKTGNLVAIKGVTDKEDLMIINRSGIIIRMAVSELRTMGRAHSGSKVDYT